MNPQRILFIDRDGTIVEEPHDEQVDAIEKIRFKPGVFRWLSFLREKTDFRFVMVSNQDGLGTASFPEDTFWPAHNFILEALKGEGIEGETEVFGDEVAREVGIHTLDNSLDTYLCTCEGFVMAGRGNDD